MHGKSSSLEIFAFHEKKITFFACCAHRSNAWNKLTEVFFTCQHLSKTVAVRFSLSHTCTSHASFSFCLLAGKSVQQREENKTNLPRTSLENDSNESAKMKWMSASNAHNCYFSMRQFYKNCNLQDKPWNFPISYELFFLFLLQAQITAKSEARDDEWKCRKCDGKTLKMKF